MRSYRLHLPLGKVVAAAAASWAAAFLLHVYVLDLPTAQNVRNICFWCFAGLIYAHLFEYFTHEVAMHRGLAGLRFIRDGHLRHHRIFYGQNFRSRRPEDLRHVTTEWYAFPALLAPHYAVLAAIYPAAAPAFLFGVTTHFIIYETGHWFTHVAANGFDRALARIPGIGPIRARQVLHHQLHHARPSVNFNFTPPYGGDRLAKTYRKT